MWFLIQRREALLQHALNCRLLLPALSSSDGDTKIKLVNSYVPSDYSPLAWLCFYGQGQAGWLDGRQGQ